MSRTVKAAIIKEAGKPPVFTETTLAAAQEGETTIKVVAAGYTHLVRARASGAHYSSPTSGSFAGFDGVGYVEGTGKLVMFFSPGGSYSQYVNVPNRNVFPLPGGCNPEKAIGNVAALFTGPVSSIMAFARVKELPANPTVVVHGVTGMSGHLAVQVAKKYFGAKRVVGIARDAQKLKDLKAKEPLLDDIISYEDDDEKVIESGVLAEADVVLDYIWGKPTERYMTVALKSKKVSTQSLTWVEIGEISGDRTIALPAAVLRSSNFNITGSGLGPLTGPVMGKCYAETTEYLAKGELSLDLHPIPLEEVAEEWVKPFNNDGGKKYFVISH